MTFAGHLLSTKNTKRTIDKIIPFVTIATSSQGGVEVPTGGDFTVQ
jgi:hypothetical protein